MRHGEKFEYPYLESLASLAPLVDELVVNVGRGFDATLQNVQALPYQHMRIIERDWQIDVPEKKKGGLILSEQTNEALHACTGDWILYLQADEILHERNYTTIRQAIEQAPATTEAFVFSYVHFYGDYSIVQESRSVYRREVRLIRAGLAHSVGDAQSFRKRDGSKLRAQLIDASIYHYGWVRHQTAMKEKTYFMDQLYHGAPTVEAEKTGQPYTQDNYRYKHIWGLRSFQGTHPLCMHKRIASHDERWAGLKEPIVVSLRDVVKILLDFFEKLTGIRLFEYRSYKLVR